MVQPPGTSWTDTRFQPKMTGIQKEWKRFVMPSNWFQSMAPDNRIAIQI
ncbi:MAG: hypothetical protein MUO26_15735 [Methanotrichaceae archaeon]|nr:hypothetical protein [Methanotrichaceae archaeon]